MFCICRKDEKESQLVCNLSEDLTKEIESYKSVVEKIVSTATEGQFKHKTWQELANFVDEFGPRFEGTKTLDESIKYVMKLANNYSLENVHGEPVQVPHWER